MRRRFSGVLMTALVLLADSADLPAQNAIWSEHFNNGCTANCEASTWNGWTVLDNVDGSTGSAPNRWYISCAEEGATPGQCGTGCGADASLHIGPDPGSGGDQSATYFETGADNATYRMVVSPTIDLSGFVENTLEFDFIAFGSPACSEDRAQLRLSADNGATWPVSFHHCLTSACCAGACNGYAQGQWTRYQLLLPAAFDNNPNVRIGFHWRNNGNGMGTDPSVAIDDIVFAKPSVDLSITMSNNVTTLVPGTAVTYTIQAASGAGWQYSPAATGVNVSNDFPDALTCSTTCVGTAGTSCTAGPFAGDIQDVASFPRHFAVDPASITYTSLCTVSAAATGTLTNTATIATSGTTFFDPSPANNSATDSDEITPDLVLRDGFEN
jgi:Domain of unknown function DUF11